MRSVSRGWFISTMQKTQGRHPCRWNSQPRPSVQHPTVFHRTKHGGQFGQPGFGPVHAGDIGDEAGGIRDRDHLDHGLGAIDEFDQHPRIHSPGAGLGYIEVGRGFHVEGVVFTFTGGDHGHA